MWFCRRRVQASPVSATRFHPQALKLHGWALSGRDAAEIMRLVRRNVQNSPSRPCGAAASGVTPCDPDTAWPSGKAVGTIQPCDTNHLCRRRPGPRPPDQKPAEEATGPDPASTGEVRLAQVASSARIQTPAAAFQPRRIPFLEAHPSWRPALSGVGQRAPTRDRQLEHPSPRPAA